MSSPEAVAAGVQASRFGTYTTVTNLTQAGRPVYQLVGSTVAYLFYSANTSNWLIGANYASSSSGVRSTDGAGAACPDQATGWQALKGGLWDSTYPIILVQTQTRSPTAPATAAPTNVGNAPVRPAMCECVPT